MLTVPGTSTTGASFTFIGTLTQADTLSFTESGNPCLQSPPSYCVNGAGVVTTAGTSPVGAATTFMGTFNGSAETWDFGALLIEISGEGAVQIFPASAANGLGSSTPPHSLTLAPTSLGALGFPSFSAVSPTITFIMADTLYSDNTGQFVISPDSRTGDCHAGIGGWLPAGGVGDAPAGSRSLNVGGVAAALTHPPVTQCPFTARQQAISSSGSTGQPGQFPSVGSG